MHTSFLSSWLSIATVLAGTDAATLRQKTCSAPEPVRRICYSVEGATPQDLNPREVAFTAKYLRSYQEERVAAGESPFWRMSLPDADNCAEWQVTTKGRTWVQAKLVGNEPAAVLFSDIAATIDGLAMADPTKSLTGCGTAGGQMGVIVDTNNTLYQSDFFKGYTNKGIIIKVVKGPA